MRVSRKASRRWRSAVVALSVLAVAAAACGDDGNKAGGTTTSASTGGSTGSTASTTTAKVTPVAGGTATVQLFSEIATLDPVVSTGSGGSDGQRMAALYGGLFAYDSNKSTMEGVQAVSLKPTSADFKSWQLVLRPNLKFTDGTVFDAEAVKANWARTQVAANRSPSRGVSAFITAMTATNATTLDITLAVANAHFVNSVERVGLNYIASKAAIDAGKDLTQTAVGAGPFKLDEWIRDSKMTLSKNPDWLGGAAPVYLDKLVLQVQSNEQQRVDSFTKGESDAFYSSVPGSIADAKKGLKDSYSIKVDVGTGQVFVMNVTKAPFDDVRVRRAIIEAIPRDVLAKDILNNSVPAEFFSLPGTPWHSANSALPKYDLVAAQKDIDSYVAEKGGPVTFTMLAFQQTLDQDRAKFIISQLSQLKNLKVDFVVNASSVNIGKVLAGDFQWSSWGFPTLDPDPGLYNAAKTKSGFNYSGYSNADVDKLLDEARVSTDDKLRAANYQKVYEQLAKDLPFFPYIVTQNSFVCSPKLLGCTSYEDGILRFDLLSKKA
jgi:peptide/nickel transport system substrate-binding protein